MRLAIGGDVADDGLTEPRQTVRSGSSCRPFRWLLRPASPHTGPQHEAKRGEVSQDGLDSLALGCGCGTRQDLMECPMTNKRKENIRKLADRLGIRSSRRSESARRGPVGFSGSGVGAANTGAAYAGPRGEAAPPVPLRELWACAAAGVVTCDGDSGGWTLVEPPQPSPRRDCRAVQDSSLHRGHGRRTTGPPKRVTRSRRSRVTSGRRTRRASARARRPSA